MWFKGLAPNSCHSQQVIGWWDGDLLLFDQQPGNGRGIPQINGELEVRAAQECMLAGQPPNQARQIGVVGQVPIPQG
jgi:hypothetical protein